MASNLKNSKKKTPATLQGVNFSKGEGNNKIDTRINVEEIQNGFLIVRTREGRDKKGEWFYETKKWYSETNPLEINTEDKTLADLFN